jgi:hypothetical protein
MLLRVCLGACRTRSTAAGDVCHENVRQVADGVSLYGPCLNLQIIMLRIVATQPEGSLERTSSYRETSITILSISSGVRFRVHAHPLPLRLRYFVVLRLYCWKTAGAYSTPCRMFRAGAIIIVSAVVALFGVASAVLGFIAEATRLKVSAAAADLGP